jgi:hypothetical protein
LNIYIRTYILNIFFFLLKKESQEDVNNFSPQFTSENKSNNQINSLQDMQNIFEGFNFDLNEFSGL